MESFLEQESEESGVEAPAAAPSAGVKRKTPEDGTESDAADAATASKKRKPSGTDSNGKDSKNDCYCWICHKEGDVICCETCPRVFHLKCIQAENNAPSDEWVCQECCLIMTAENMDTRSRAMRLLSVDQLCSLLRHALSRLRSVSGVDPFLSPVDVTKFPAYPEYVSFPMDLQTMERNIRTKEYGSTEAFLADVKWILHNCVIFNSTASKLTAVAKTLVKVARHEMKEIENCPDCYVNAHVKKDSWFVAACRVPHLLVWAKLKGFPFWPGKAMRSSSEEGVDVRFFGAHDRAWIPLKDVFLFSEEAPVSLKNKKKFGNLESCLEEVELFIKNAKERFGEFEYAPAKTAYEPKREEEQIKILYPKCELPFELGSSRRRVRSYSFSGSERSQTATPTELSEADGEDRPAEQQQESEEPMETEEKEEEGMSKEAPEEPKKTTDLERVKAGEEKRMTVSPPCEVSSTTMAAAEKAKTPEESSKPEAAAKDGGKAAEEPSELKPMKVATIAETSETVVIEGEVDDDEDEVIEEIDDVEPEEQSKKQQQTEKSPEKEEAQKAVDSDSAPAALAGDVSAPEIDDVEPEEEEGEAEPSAVASEPSSAAVSEPSPGAEQKTASLVGPGVSVTKLAGKESLQRAAAEGDAKEAPPPAAGKEKPAPTTAKPKAAPKSVKDKIAAATAAAVASVTKEQPPKADQEKAASDASKIGLGSDISVTVVQKRKPDTINLGSTASKSPRISIKKESELLASGDKLEVRSVTKAKKSFPGTAGQSLLASKATKEGAKDTSASSSSKSPPDPIVTISKVQSMASGAAAASAGPSLSVKPSSQLLQNPPSSSAGSTSSSDRPRVNVPPRSTLASATVPPQQLIRPAVSTVRSSAPSTNTSVASMASILGSTRPPGGIPSFRSAVPPLPTGVRPGAPGSPLLRMPGGPAGQTVRATHPPPPPTGPIAMPSLHPRPLSNGVAPSVPLPPAAGPVSEQMHKMAGKLVDYMRGTLEDLFRELANQGSPEAQVKALQLEMEKMQWRHQQELSESKHNTDLMLMEMRQSHEAEKQKIVADLKKQAEVERQKAIAETKKKQWCAYCGKEAIFYCCWNTSYCDYPCQQAHWPTHMTTCAQNSANQEEDSAGGNGEAASNGGGGAAAAAAAAAQQQQQAAMAAAAAAAAEAAGMEHLMSLNAAVAASAASQMPSQKGLGHSRAMQRPGMMPPMGGHPGAGLNPRMMSHLGMRFPPGRGPGSMPPGGGGMRFGGYFG